MTSRDAVDDKEVIMSLQGTGRGFLIAAAALSVAVAIMLLTGVIQPVTEEFHRGGTPLAAVIAFWFDSAVFLLAAALFAWFARTAGRTGYGRRVAGGVSGVILVFIALCFVDAGAAYSGHGAAMSAASGLMFVCAATGGLAGVLAVIQACWLARVRRVQ